MDYSFLAGGKRIRPMLMMETHILCGGDGRLIAPFMAALEMIHTYSLVHDDLPAMDGDELRRGKPTTWVQFDEATAILAGDGLLTYAPQFALQSEWPGEVKAQCTAVLLEMAGPAGMVLGQCLDMKEEEGVTDWEALKEVHRNKTGCLLSAPLMIGACLCGHAEDAEKWHEIGEKTGLAFQIQDDILDTELTPEEFGKSTSDEGNNKVTSVNLLGIEEAADMMERLYSEAEDGIRLMEGFDSAPLISLIEQIRVRRK
jgi:geranylgeranyl pyrophosphate synthase